MKRKIEESRGKEVRKRKEEKKSNREGPAHKKKKSKTRCLSREVS
jgi:hypothetical protein